MRRRGRDKHLMGLETLHSEGAKKKKGFPASRCSVRSQMEINADSGAHLKRFFRQVFTIFLSSCGVSAYRHYQASSCVFPLSRRVRLPPSIGAALS